MNSGSLVIHYMSPISMHIMVWGVGFVDIPRLLKNVLIVKLGNPPMTELERFQTIVVPIAPKHGVKKVWLFGSRARGDAKRDRDYEFVYVVMD